MLDPFLDPFLGPMFDLMLDPFLLQNKQNNPYNLKRYSIFGFISCQKMDLPSGENAIMDGNNYAQFA